MSASFIFSQIDPLDSTLPENVKSVTRIGDVLFFEIIENDKPRQKRKPWSQFLQTQIEQFQIPFYQ